MNRITLTLAIALSVPVAAQTVYKCPQPDGSIAYQKSRCPEGGRIGIQDNGKQSGAVQAVTPPAINPTAPPAAAVQPANRYGSSVTESPAWKGLDRIQAESTQTINALTRKR